MKYYVMQWAQALDEVVLGSHPYLLPTFDCPVCGAFGSNGISMPWVEAEKIFDEKNLRRLLVNKQPKSYGLEEYKKHAEILKELGGGGMAVPPGSVFGKFKGRIRSQPPDFQFQINHDPAVLVKRSVLVRLNAFGFNLEGFETDLKNTIGAEELLELWAPPVGEAANMRLCPECNNSPDKNSRLIRLETIPPDVHFFRLVNHTWEFIISGALVDKINELGFTGLRLRELNTEGTPSEAKLIPALRAEHILASAKLAMLELARPQDSQSLPTEKHAKQTEKASKFSSKAWAESATEFVTLRKSELPGFSAKLKMDPVLTTAKLQALQKKLPVKIPAAVASFLSDASGGCHFRYKWQLPEAARELAQAAGLDEEQIFGGAEFCVAKKLAEWGQDCKAWATETWLADDAEQQAIWLQCFPIAALENGDYLAIHSDEKTAGEVVYLAHDEESKVIAPSLAAFLEHWALLGYVGPEMFILESFVDGDTGFLNGKTEQAKAVQALFEFKA